MKKNFWFWLVLLIIIATLISLALYDKFVASPTQSKKTIGSQNQALENNLSAAAEEASQIPTINVGANP